MTPTTSKKATSKTTSKSSKSNATAGEKTTAPLTIAISVEKTKLDAFETDAMVVFTSTKGGGDKKSVAINGLTPALQERVQKAVELKSVTGAASETVLFRDAQVGQTRHLLVLGLGDPKKLTGEGLRQAAAGAFAALKSAKVKSFAVAVDSLPSSPVQADAAGQALAEGLLLAGYSFTEFKTGKGSDDGVEHITLLSSKAKAFEKGVLTGATIAECVNFSRWLGDRPGNRMTPTILGEEAQAAAKGTKLKVSVWDKTKIKSEKMGSFLSVSLGSDQEPKFIIMEYKGGAASKAPVCFVGKGLTFDSGGISIKPSAGMEEMKYDMCGGANVIGTMLAIAKLGLKVNAIGLVPTTENMPGPSANKPGDIVVARNGKTIEVNNTDAEGRLILNDALVYGCEQKPAAIFDIATLTGAMVVALGNLHTGFFTRNDKLATKVEAMAKKTGEWVWRMPLTDFHGKDMKGTYADLSNVSSSKGAGSATAAAFLENFVEKDIPWAHFDIAGTGWHVGDRVPYCPRKGASGVMIRTFIELAQAF